MIDGMDGGEVVFLSSDDSRDFEPRTTENKVLAPHTEVRTPLLLP